MIRELIAIGVIVSALHPNKQTREVGMAIMLASAFVSFVSNFMHDDTFSRYYQVAMIMDWIVFEFIESIRSKRALSKFIQICCIISFILNAYGLALWHTYSDPMTYNNSQSLLMMVIVCALFWGTGGAIFRQCYELLDRLRYTWSNAVLYMGKIFC